jgi:type IV secretory pathway TraG/TraD family ATPase VirD4
LLTAINAPGGLNLADTMRDGGCVYVIGSMRNSRVIMAQRMLFVRLLQLVETRDRVAGPVRPVCVFLDEVKYHLSRPALEGLGAARDKGMHLILAHQSLGDLRDCPADLDAEAVVGAVVENCGLRVAYRVKNPETAEWLAAMSGEILVDDETRRVERNAAGSEVMDHERTVRQATRYLVDVNMLLNLPDRSAVLYGVGLPQFAHICPIQTQKEALTVYEAPSVEIEKPAVPNIAPQALADATEGVGHADALPIPTKSLQSAEVKPEKPASPKKDLAAQLIDLEDHDVDI